MTKRVPIRIHFEPWPLDEIQPWGDELHWFGLTYGWYDVQIGDHRLFSTVDEPTRGVDYQIARLWHDLIEVAPYALAPLPDTLIARCARGDGWEDWIACAGHSPVDGALFDLAVAWWKHHRTLDSGHLRDAPCLTLWRVGDDVHARWRTNPWKADAPTWCSPAGDAILDAQQLTNELTRFDRALMAAMRSRIEAVAVWDRHEVQIDLELMRKQHDDQATWLDSRLARMPGGLPDWSEVIAALEELEKLT
jgi:hypothetical protein